MDNMNVRLYKDGNDIIVVYKNGVEYMEEISSKIFSPLVSQQIPVKEVPLIPLAKEKEEEPLSVQEIEENSEEKYEDIYPSFTEDDDEEVAEEVIEVKEEVSKVIDPEEILKKDKFEGFIKLLELINSNSDIENRDDIIKSLKNYYISNKKNINDSNRLIKHDDLKKLIHVSYSLFKEAIDDEIKKKGYINLDAALIGMTPFDVRGLYWKVITKSITEMMNSLN